MQTDYLAPTTSTTMMIAFGDTIALCLLKRKEFKEQLLNNLHSGGALYKYLLTIKDLMHTNTPIMQENDLMKDVYVQ